MFIVAECGVNILHHEVARAEVTNVKTSQTATSNTCACQSEQ